MTTERIRLWWSASLLAVTISVACGDSGGGEDEAADGPTCEPGSVDECACTDGSTGTQTCNAEGSGYDACACGQSETSDTQNDGSTDDDTDSTTDTSDATESTDGTESDGSETSDATEASDDTDTTDGPIGEAPMPEIWHPSDGETRTINTPIPWIGAATDAEDGDLSGMSLVWSSDLDGEFGTGTMFDAPLTSVGVHVITLTATDSDGQQGVATIELTLEP
jgi:hypothetical protein